jgi:NTE family protein
MIEPMTRAVVLGGGGVAGIAWETGVLTGLADEGVDLTRADLVVGTSAGSAVAAQLTSGLEVAELFRRQVDPDAQSPEIPAEFDPEKIAEIFGLGAEDTTDTVDRTELRRRIGNAALLAETVSEPRRRDVIAARLPVHTWPSAKLLIVAVDATTGEERIFDAASGVPLVDAVAASCAVPGIWPPVTIGDSRYVDGGMRSPENADLAVGHDVVLVFQAMRVPEMDDLDAQVETLRRQGSTVLVITADERSVDAIGTNPLDPTTREAAARAGRLQGIDAAATVARTWS